MGRARVQFQERGQRKVSELPVWALRFVESVDRSVTPLVGEEAANLMLLAMDRARSAPEARPTTGLASAGALCRRVWSSVWSSMSSVAARPL